MVAQIGTAGKVARLFVESKLTPLIVCASILLGIASVIALPREEEPQIIVPMIDIFVQMPGAGAKEVEQRITGPMDGPRDGQATATASSRATGIFAFQDTSVPYQKRGRRRDQVGKTLPPSGRGPLLIALSTLLL